MTGIGRIDQDGNCACDRSLGGEIAQAHRIELEIDPIRRGPLGRRRRIDQLRLRKKFEVVLEEPHAFLAEFDCGGEWPEPWHRVFLTRFARPRTRGCHCLVPT